MKLVIADKCYSSWSLRPWILMKAKGIAFEEVVVDFSTPDFNAAVNRHVPGAAGKVPSLADGDIAVWESLAILEYLAEKFPAAGIWPADRAARAQARAIASEMHAGFRDLRSACPMNIGKRYGARDRGAGVSRDVARITENWRAARARFGAGGPFLYGDFSAADAMYAPVVARLDTYAITVDPVSTAYIEAVLAHPAYREWLAAALKEPWIVPSDEVDEPPLVVLRNL